MSNGWDPPVPQQLFQRLASVYITARRHQSMFLYHALTFVPSASGGLREEYRLRRHSLGPRPRLLHLRGIPDLTVRAAIEGHLSFADVFTRLCKIPLLQDNMDHGPSATIPVLARGPAF